jgi:hypothetical protein
VPATQPPAGPEPSEPAERSGADAGSPTEVPVSLTGAAAESPAQTESPRDIENPADTESPASDVDWDELPEPVRLRLAELAAGAAAALPSADVPAPVRRVARFAPVKRARVGGPVLLAGLRDSPAFRAAVTEWARKHRAELLDPSPANTADAAAAAVLLGEQEAGELVGEVARRASDGKLRVERDAALARVERL